MKARAHVIFQGRVQGVFFRANTERKAIEHGLKGWVRNLPDGTVEAVFEGEKSTVEKVVDWCTHRQPQARVDNAKLTWEEYTGEFKQFRIQR